MKGAVLAVVVAAGLLTQVGFVNTAAFDVRSARLEMSLRSAEAAGVPRASLQPARDAMRSIGQRWQGPLPYPTVSGAVIWDPFTGTEQAVDKAHAQAANVERSRAAAALGRLHDVSGPNDRAYYEGLATLGSVREPADYNRLARKWEAQTASTGALRDRLAGSSGGLAGGLPKDAVDGLSRLQSLADAALNAGMSSEPAWQTSVDVQLYLARPYPGLVDRHAAIMKELNDALSTLDKRVNARKTAEAALARMPALLPQAEQYGIGDKYSGQAKELQSRFQQARTDDDMVKVADAADALLKDLEAANEGRMPLSEVGCIQGAPEKLISIHLATQQLVAYQNGCPYLRTPITTGRPALPTGRGTFHIFYKARSYKMVSPWAKPSPFWYPDAWVYNAMEFIGDGTFIHNANWQPDASYGPGSQFGPYSSHGCVHVLDGPLAQLYDWAPIGTTVVVGD
jgi:L,D-transpeptidase catalytic domain